MTGNLNGVSSRMIIATITPYIEMWAKIIYSVKSEIYQDAVEIVIFSKPLASSSGMFTSLVEIQASVKESEQKRLDLKNANIWSKSYLPPTRTTKKQGN